jgi:replicative DNA helicase
LLSILQNLTGKKTTNMDIKKMFQKEQDLKDYAGDDRVVSSKEYIEEQEKIGAQKTRTVSSGFAKLDGLIKGFQGGELITITGPTKNGKSSWAHTLTKNFESQGIVSVWFSYEVGPMQMIEQFSKSQIFYLPRRIEKRNIDWIRDRAIEAKVKYEIGAMFVDTLDEVVSLERARGNLSVETGQVVSELKSLAIDLDIPVFQLTHLTKTKYDMMPTESDIRDSSFITQKSDKTIIVWRERKKNSGKKKQGTDEEYTFSGNTIVVVSNDRRTGTMGKQVKMTFDNGEFKELESDYDKDLKEATGDINPELIPF